MKQLIRILTVHTVRDLFRYRSFCILIFGLFLLDRVVHHDSGQSLIPSSWQPENVSTSALAGFVFNELPGHLAGLILQWQTWLILAGLFLLKQLISMWPSSDMRRMHRNERSGFGILGALTAIGGQQVAWDAIAIISLCGAVGVWTLVWFVVLRWGWLMYPVSGWLWTFGLMVFIASPLTLAGFSYSSKLAVLSQGAFGRKLALFFRLFTDGGLFWRSWSFYFLRQTVEMAFVAVLPTWIILSVPQPWLRILLAGMVATPVYSYLKMASFKFFLYAYGGVPEVHAEYATYYQNLASNFEG